MSTPSPASPSSVSAAPRRQLTLWDSTSIIVGIIIGSSLYESSPMIARAAAGPWTLVAVWALGGLLSLVGALCYVELATAFPAEGGDYVYLNRGFGRTVGFLFAWAQLWIVRPGSVGAMAFVFARYANELYPLGQGPWPLMVYAAGAIVVLTAINLLGLQQGKWTQNILTAVKVLGLAAVVLVGLVFSTPSAPAPSAAATSDIGFAMILIFYAFGGWNEMAYVAAEVKDPHRNIPRALVLGTVAVTAIYVLATMAFIHALGFAGLCQTKAVAADVLRFGLGDLGGRLISMLICVSALGAINGMIFTGARITYAMGRDHSLYAWLGSWNEHRGTPVWSMVVQAAITLALVFGFGRAAGGFEKLIIFTTPVFWIFFLLVGLAVFLLRWREPQTTRPYRVPFYPVTPVVFCLSSAYMVYASVVWAISNQSAEALWSIGILALGVVLLAFERIRHGARP